MSTEINIKKKISILEESVAITTDVKSIDFVGTGVVASTIGDDVTVTINENVLFFNSYSAFPVTGLDGFMYVDNTGNIAYLWDTVTSTYVVVGAGPVIPPDPSPIAFANAVTTAVLLYAPIYYNGLANDGVGATLTATANGIVSDGSLPNKIDTTYTPVATDIVLVKNQALQKQNGLYEITIVGSASTTYLLTRVGDYDETSELYPLQVNVLPGGSNGLTLYNQTTVNPIVGTSNIVFLTTSASNGYVIPTYFVDTVTTAALPTCVYANGLIYPVTIPGYLATLTASVNGALGTINGLTANVSTTPALSFSRILVKNQVNPAHNGSYVVINAGSATTKWVLRRIHYTSTAFDRYSQNFMVSNTGSTKIGKYYFTSPNVPVLTNAFIGTAAINIIEYGGSNAGLIYITNQTTGVVTYYTTLELARDGSVSGDTIYVNTGTYVVTTTDANGLSKSGVNWFFQPGAVVSKATIGNIFNDTGFANTCNIFGKAVFNKTATTGNISTITKSYSVFECHTFSVTNSYGIDVSGSYSNVSFVYGISSGNGVLYIGASYCNINFVNVKSTATSSIQCAAGSNYSMITGNFAESTVSRSIYISGASGLIFNIDNVTGNGEGFGAYASSSIIFTGNTNHLYLFGGGGTTFNGYATIIKASGLLVGGARCGSLIVNNDYGDTGAVNVTMQGSGLSIVVSAGVANVKLPKACTYLATTVSGGVLNFENTRFEDGYFYGAGYDFVISGGRVNLNNLQSELVDRSYAFKLTGGILDLGSSRTKNTSSALIPYVANGARQSGIYWTGGTIISNGARIITANDDCLSIQAVSTGLSMKVLSAGFNTTNTTSITTAKKQKVKCTVASVLSTSITLNDGSGGNEIFTEANTGVYNTVALLAQRMVSLINASATLDITASQDIPGTDAYFYLESDVSGTAFTIPASANIVVALVRPNSNAFTVLCGSSIIQDINID